MTSLYMVITNLDNTQTGNTTNISFNYGTSLNSNGNINLLGASPSSGVSNFYDGVSFPNALPGINSNLTIGDVYVCFGGPSIIALNTTHDIDSQMYQKDDLTPIGTIALPLNIPPNFGSSLGQFGTCAAVNFDYGLFTSGLNNLPCTIEVVTSVR